MRSTIKYVRIRVYVSCLAAVLLTTRLCLRSRMTMKTWSNHDFNIVICNTKENILAAFLAVKSWQKIMFLISEPMNGCLRWHCCFLHLWVVSAATPGLTLQWCRELGWTGSFYSCYNPLTATYDLSIDKLSLIFFFFFGIALFFLFFRF